MRALVLRIAVLTRVRTRLGCPLSRGGRRRRWRPRSGRGGISGAIDGLRVRRCRPGRTAGRVPVLPDRGGLEVDRQPVDARPAPIARSLLRRDEVVEPTQGLRRLGQVGAVADPSGREQLRQVFQLGQQARALRQVRIRELMASRCIGFDDRVGGLDRAQREKGGEILRRIGDLGVLPAGDPHDPAGGAVALVLEGEEQVVLLETAVDRCRSETPPRDVVEHALPPSEQPGGHESGRGAPIDIGLPTASAVVGLVGRHPGLLEEAPIDIVDRSDGPGDVGRQPRPWQQGGEVDASSGDERCHDRPPSVAQRRRTCGARHAERDVTGQQLGQGTGLLQLRRRDGVHRHAHDPTAALGVLDETDSEALTDPVDEFLDTGGVDAAHGGVGQRGEGPGSAAHPPTVVTSRRAAVNPLRVPPRAVGAHRARPARPGGLHRGLHGGGTVGDQGRDLAASTWATPGRMGVYTRRRRSVRAQSAAVRDRSVRAGRCWATRPTVAGWSMPGPITSIAAPTSEPSLGWCRGCSLRRARESWNGRRRAVRSSRARWVPRSGSAARSRPTRVDWLSSSAARWGTAAPGSRS